MTYRDQGQSGAAKIVSPDIVDLAEALAVTSAVDLGARIKRARLGQSLRQSDVTSGDISTPFLSRIESGDRRPDMKVLKLIARRLGTSPHELLLGISPTAWSQKRVDLDWAQMSLHTGAAGDALETTTRLLDELPVGTRLRRRAINVHALALEATGDYEQASRWLEDLLSGEPTDVPVLEALTALSRCYRQAGAISRAMDVGHRANRLVEELGLAGSPEAIKLTLTVAAAHCESGDVGYAARLCRDALADAENLNSPSDIASCYWNASIIESRRGNHAEAVTLVQRAVFTLDQVESTRNAARLRTQLGILRLRLSPPETDGALDDLRKAEQELRTCDASPADLASNRLGQARAQLLVGRLDAAEEQAAACLAAVEGTAPLVAAEARVLLGQVAFARGSMAEAIEHYTDAVALLGDVGAHQSAAQIWYELGSMWTSLNRPEEALTAFKNAGALTGLRPSPLTITNT